MDSWPPLPPTPPRRPMRRCTAATRSGRPRCRPRSPDAAATAVRCRSIGMRRWRCSPNTRWTCSRCYRLASCGWRRRGCIRSTGCSTPSTEAFALLESLGNPLLWSVPLHWAGVHAGILANSPEAVAPHGQALTAAAAHSAFAKALASAGRTWLRVLANHVDTDEVTVGGSGAVAVRTHLGRHPIGQPGRAADPRRPRLGRDAAVGARPQADRRDRRGAGLEPGRPPRTARAPARRGPRPPGCPTASARSPNCCCWACRTATSAASCSSRPRPSSTTSRGSGAGSAPSRGRRCCRCCARCWRLRADAPNAAVSPNRNPLSGPPSDGCGTGFAGRPIAIRSVAC